MQMVQNYVVAEILFHAIVNHLFKFIASEMRRELQLTGSENFVYKSMRNFENVFNLPRFVVADN